MIYFALAVAFTVTLYLIMRAYPRYGVNSFHAVVFNYYSCIATGLVLTSDFAAFKTIQWDSAGIIYTFALGGLFVLTFLMIGLSAQKVSVTAASLAGNMSLVIPVLFGLFVFQNNNKDFTPVNYLGLIVALAALALGALQPGSSKDETPKTGLAQSVWIFPVLAFFASGTNNTLINFLSSAYYQPGQTTLFMIVACAGAVAIGTTILVFRLFSRDEKLHFRSVIGGLILGVPNFLSLYFLLLALGSFGNSAAFVFPIYNILTMLVSSFTAWIFYREKLSNLNRLGLVLAVAAIIMISYQELGL